MPAIIFADGFDHYTTILDKWDKIALNGPAPPLPIIAPGAGRGGAGALYISGAGFGSNVALGTNYQYLMLQSLTDPNTGAAWTLPAVNAAEFGVKITN
jgi:hypothetical protein